MSKKILVTKEFHREAMIAIEFKRLHSSDDIAEKLRQAWMSFIECKADEELIEEFSNYCEEYLKEMF